MATDVHADSVRIPYGGREIEVYDAQPQSIGAAPQVLIIHEWWGLDDHIRAVARRLAAEGFRALAPVLYDGRTTKDAGEAAALMAGLDQREALGKLSAVIDSSGERAGATGVLGFCMGGSYALLLAERPVTHTAVPRSDPATQPARRDRARR